MGTYYGYDSKNEIREELRGSLNGTVLADRTVGNNWWAAVERPDGTRLLFLAKMSKSQGVWGYKPLCDSEGISADLCNCPMSLLEIVEEAPLPTGLGEMTLGWVNDTRDRIRAYHEARNRVWEMGDLCEIHGHLYSVLAVVTKTKAHVRLEETGVVYSAKLTNMKPVTANA